MDSRHTPYRLDLVAALDWTSVALTGRDRSNSRARGGHGHGGSGWWRCTPRSRGGDRKESKEEHRQNGGVNTGEHVDCAKRKLKLKGK